MTVALVVLAFVTGLALGLWWGERGRREAAEHWKVYGAPELRPAQAFEPEPEPETRARVMGEFPEATIDRGAKDLMAHAKEAGRQLSVSDARAMARSMLATDLTNEGT